MQPILDPSWLVETVEPAPPVELDPFVDDLDFLASDLSGLAAFLLGVVDEAAVRAACARTQQRDGLRRLTELLDDCSPRHAA